MLKINKLSLIIIAILFFVGVIFYNYSKLPASTTNNVNSTNNIITGPKIEVSSNSFDLGVVKYGDIVQKIIKLTNSGNEPLQILRLSTSCGCTQATMAEKDKIIAPNSTVDMLITFDPAVHKDDTDIGELVRVIYIKSNDINNPEVEINMKANVIK